MVVMVDGENKVVHILGDGPIKKHDGEPIIIKFQDPFIHASKFINFLGVEILILFTILFIG